MRTLQLLVAAFALIQLLRYGRGALLFLAPRVRVEGDAAAPPASPGRRRAGATLEALGFVRLGVRRERAPLGALARDVECYARPEPATWADVTDDRRGAAAIELVTSFPDGAVVATADHESPTRGGPRVRAGALPGTSPAQLIAAHDLAVARAGATHGSPVGVGDLGSRIELARAWYRGEGRRELRRGRGTAVVIAGIAVLLLASAVSNLTRQGR